MAILRSVSLARNILQLRGELTQEALGSAIGVKQSYISKWESGKTRPSLRLLLKLAVALNVSLDRFVLGLNAKYDAARQQACPGGTASEREAAAEARIKDLQRRLSEAERERDDLKARIRSALEPDAKEKRA